MGIKENLEKAQEAIGKDLIEHDPSLLANSVRDAAIKAIKGGMNSVAWQRYMALFCDTADELAQLTVEREGDGSYMAQVRAYTPATAICLPITNTQITNGVNNALPAGESIEPIGGVEVPDSILDPAKVRDENLFKKLRPAEEE